MHGFAADAVHLSLVRQCRMYQERTVVPSERKSCFEACKRANCLTCEPFHLPTAQRARTKNQGTFNSSARRFCVGLWQS